MFFKSICSFEKFYSKHIYKWINRWTNESIKYPINETDSHKEWTNLDEYTKVKRRNRIGLVRYIAAREFIYIAVKTASDMFNSTWLAKQKRNSDWRTKIPYQKKGDKDRKQKYAILPPSPSRASAISSSVVYVFTQGSEERAKRGSSSGGGDGRFNRSQESV